MANNRMYLRNTRTGARIYFAKYYPSTGWYMTKTADEVNAAFDQADFAGLSDEQLAANASHKGLGVPFPSGGGMWGDEWELEYECVSDEPQRRLRAASERAGAVN